jgi:hypothetical protein
MKMFSKESLIGAAGLGLGSAAAGVVKSKVLATQKPIIQDAAPVLLGLFLSGQKGIVGSIGKGMIANGVGSIIAKNVPGLGDVMLGDASTMVATDGSSDTLLGDDSSYGTYGYDDASADGTDSGYGY